MDDLPIRSSMRPGGNARPLQIVSGRNLGRLGIALLLTLFGAIYANAQEGAAKEALPAAKPPPQAIEGRASTLSRLPAASVTQHVIDLADGPLHYTATAGALPVRDLSGRMLGEIAYIAYRRSVAGEKVEQGRRPIVFAFNGGPGASSAYLNIGAFGPRRVAFGRPGDVPSAPPILFDNPETWLSFADLVFIDPVGTGFSRFASGADDARGTLWSVEGDYRSLSRFIANWLRANDRIGSPIYLAGESYGGFRAPKIASELQTSDGIGVSGLILISPVLDFTFQRDARDTPIKWAVTLPSLAAMHLEAAGRLSPDQLSEAEAYATGEYLTDLLKGPRDPQARARISERIAKLTGLDRELVERRAGKIDSGTFLRELGRKESAVGSPYDGMVRALDPAPDAARSQAPDAVLDAATAPLTSAMLNHYSHDLKWSPEGRYMLLNSEIGRRWNYGAGRGDRESISELRKVLALDPQVRVLVAHGYSDLVTPYLESKLLLDQLPALGDPQRVKLALFAGGHMFYARDNSRAGLRDAVRQMLEPRQELQ